MSALGRSYLAKAEVACIFPNTPVKWDWMPEVLEIMDKF